MAIYGAGSLWDRKELKQDFFKNNNYVIGWEISEAKNLYTLASEIKAGDIIYLKSNQRDRYP